MLVGVKHSFIEVFVLSDHQLHELQDEPLEIKSDIRLVALCTYEPIVCLYFLLLNHNIVKGELNWIAVVHIEYLAENVPFVEVPLFIC